MSVDAFIEEALRRGETEGLGSLDRLQARVFAISEAEVYCAMEGIDGLLDRYGKHGLAPFVDAFSRLGAADLAAAFEAIQQSPEPVPELLRSRANDLVNEHKGYDYEALRAHVASELPLLGAGIQMLTSGLNGSAEQD